jgi:sedoheptulokinase
MIAIGIDIGTTSISATVLDGKTGRVLAAVTEENGARIGPEFRWEALQDADIIWQKTQRLLRFLIASHGPVGAIGLTGQMHGIVYLNEQGQAISPLYTWQDGRGDQPHPEGGSYADVLSAQSG